MRGRIIIVTLAALAALTVIATRFHFSEEPAKPRSISYTPADEEPVCPWRNPDADMRALFPDATSQHLETKALSAMRPQLIRILGRQPTGADHALHVYRISAGETPRGSVLAKRVKGEHGAVELVIALSTNGVIRGVSVQRSREPESIARLLEPTGWISAFDGKSVTNRFQLDDDLPTPPVARATATAIAEGIRVALAMMALADGSDASHSAH